MPSDAAGPVAESVTPILMSAMAMPALSSEANASRDFSILIFFLRKECHCRRDVDVAAAEISA
jgi:hypothetical protein